MFPARRLIHAAFLVFVTTALAAQNREPRDSVVKELSAQSNQLIEEHGISYRKVIGPARFLHNNTYLVCDTALWNVNSGVIEATGNVQILQDQTVLKSDRLEYVIDENVARFRGVLVQLQDKDRNTLRTKYLDYNTRDSVAIFYNGGALRDKDGQVIESITGTYDSKIKTFTFTDQVNMYTDSVFIETSRLSYDTDRQLAVFGSSTRAWKDDNILASNAGWYNRTTGEYLFKDAVHLQTEAQEGWADSLFYYSVPGNAEMLGHAQVLDTSRNGSALAGRMFYEDSLSRITLTREPVIIARTGSEDKPDTLWFGADKLVYQGVRKCDIAESVIKASQKRVEEISSDAVTQYRRHAAEEARKAYGLELTPLEEIRDADCVIAAVAHREFAALGVEGLQRLYGGKSAKILIDVKGMFNLAALKRSDILWWRL